MKQLEEIDTDVIDGLRVRKFYRGPCTSPVGEVEDESDGVDGEESKWDRRDRFRVETRTGLTALSVSDVENFRDFVPIDLDSISRTTLPHRGLRENGVQVLATALPQAHRQVENVSPYYCQPLIETSEEARKYYHQPSPFNFNDGDEWEDEIDKTITYIPKNFGSREETVSKVWFGRREFLPKKGQPPAKSLILYLVGTGRAVEDIAEIVVRLDKRFVRSSTSRWWNGVRVPEHWEFDETSLRGVYHACTVKEATGKNHYDAFVGLNGMVSRLTCNQARLLIRQTLEEYMWWRLRGGEKLGNNGGVYGIVGPTALVGFESVTLPTIIV